MLLRWGAFSLVAAVFILILALANIHVAQSASPVSIYDPDSQHIWNRVYRQFYVRTTDTGQEFGADTLDPPLWYETVSLLKSPTYQQTLDVLDEFLKTDAEHLITNPIKRALFQRDLWAVFDWLSLRTDTYFTERQAIQKRVAQIMRRVALNDAEIAALPKNYEMAIAAHRFAAQYRRDQPLTPFLPPDLWRADSSWVNVGDKNGIAAIIHVQAQLFSGRSAFYVFYGVPTGRQATLDFIEALNSARSTHQTPTLPENTQVALVRQMLVIDMMGGIMPTPITESIQLRVLSPRYFLNVYQFNLNRRLLFSDQSGGLYAVTPNDSEFPVFMDHGIDPFETKVITLEQARVTTLEQCRDCHSENGVKNIISYSRIHFPPPSGELPILTVTNTKTEAGLVLDWKQSQQNWQVLKKFWSGG